MSARPAWLSLLVTVLAATGGAGQDAHYWTFQYGPRASLLGGAVIGSVDDVSATYYNPAALALAPSLTFAVSAHVLEYDNLSLEDGGGQGVDLGTTTTGLRPSLVAGTIKTGLFGRGVLAYSALTRVKGSQDLEGILVLSGTEVPPNLSLQDVAGVVRFEGEFSDFWAGLSYAHALGSHFGVGVTWYGAVRSQRRRILSIAEAVGLDLSGGSVIDIRGGKYSTIRTLAKFGAFGVVGPVTGGLTLTTPSLHISGSGQLGLNEATLLADSVAELALAIQTDLPARYKSPLSVGLGGSVRLGRTRIHGSGEWYQAIDPYVVMQGRSFVAQQPQVTMTPDAVQEAAAVIDWGAALERTFSDRLRVYGSFSTDNSSFTDEVERASLSTIPIDIKAVTGGFEFGVSSARFTLGAGYAWGRKIDQELTDVLQGTSEDFQATFVFRSLRLIFGFEVGLN